MQDFPLVVTTIIDYAARWHGRQEVVSCEVDGSTTTSSYAEVAERSRLTTLALRRLGVKSGDRIGTLAWNTVRHVQSWYGIAGAGAACHTLNPRLFLHDLEYIINHAQDTMILLDAPFVDIISKLHGSIPHVRTFVVLTNKAGMPTTGPRFLCYDDLIEAERPGLHNFAWTPVPETAASGICYTSGTTGKPKGVAYTHRSNFLHSTQLGFADTFGLGTSSTFLMLVPMFHANAWGFVFGCPMFGMRLVLPGPDLSGKNVTGIMRKHRVTFACGVPTIFAGLLLHLEQSKEEMPPSLVRVNIGGSAMPISMLQAFDKAGVDAVHAWGMTELSPIGAICSLRGYMRDWDKQRRQAMQHKQGRPFIFTDLRIVDENGRERPRDGKTSGELQSQGAHTVQEYLQTDKPAVDSEGWFSTGDVATIDEHGYMQITDRSKDVVKSGGEWISSIEIENLACAHPKVAEAAVVAIPHKKWDERPLLIVVAKLKGSLSRDDMLHHLQGKIARWWMPDDVVFVDELPHTATGKISKMTLRQRYKNYQPDKSKM